MKKGPAPLGGWGGTCDPVPLGGWDTITMRTGPAGLEIPPDLCLVLDQDTTPQGRNPGDQSQMTNRGARHGRVGTSTEPVRVVRPRVVVLDSSTGTLEPSRSSGATPRPCRSNFCPVAIAAEPHREPGDHRAGDVVGDVVPAEVQRRDARSARSRPTSPADPGVPHGVLRDQRQRQDDPDVQRGEAGHALDRVGGRAGPDHVVRA